MKRTSIFLLIILVISFLSMKTVSAYANIQDDCLDDQSCMLLCNYDVKYTQGGSYSTGYQSRTASRTISIYLYYETNEYKVKWETVNNTGSIYSKGPNSLDYIFSDSGNNIYRSNDIDLDDFYCPIYGYLDMSDLNSNNELCFDNDGTTCAGKSNIGTSFGTDKSSFVSTENDYNVFDHIDIYMKDWVFGDITDEQLKSGDFDPEEQIIEKFETDFKQNFLFGKPIPEVIRNYVVENQEVFYGDMIEELEERQEALLQQIQDDYDAGLIDEETYQEQMNTVGSIDPDAVVESMQEYINTDFGENVYYLGMDCDTMFGDPDNPNEPAYWIQWSLDIIKYVALIGVFGLCTVDFIKAIVAQDQDAIKKAGITAAKRFVFAVLIFFLPIVIEFIMTLFGAYGTCGFE